MPGQERDRRPTLVPNGVVQNDNHGAPGMPPEQKTQELSKVVRVDGRREVSVNASMDRIHRPEDVRLAMVAGPGHDPRLFPAKPPRSRQCGRQLNRNFVGEKEIQAFQMPGASQQNLQSSFFLARSRGSLPGSAWVGRRRRHPK